MLLSIRAPTAAVRFAKTQLIGYGRHMPTVLRQEGFEVVIRTDDHEPPHVHVFHGGASAKIMLESLREEHCRLTRRQLVKALILVKQHQEWLLARWREIHG
jgi:hypothetical protein